MNGEALSVEGKDKQGTKMARRPFGLISISPQSSNTASHTVLGKSAPITDCQGCHREKGGI